MHVRWSKAGQETFQQLVFTNFIGFSYFCEYKKALVHFLKKEHPYFALSHDLSSLRNSGDKLKKVNITYLALFSNQMTWVMQNIFISTVNK